MSVLLANVNGTGHSSGNKLFHSGCCLLQSASRAAAEEEKNDVAIELTFAIYKLYHSARFKPGRYKPSLLKNKKTDPIGYDLMFQRSLAENRKLHRVSAIPVNN